jgi:hypothetical protein
VDSSVLTDGMNEKIILAEAICRLTQALDNVEVLVCLTLHYS